MIIISSPKLVNGVLFVLHCFIYVGLIACYFCSHIGG